MTEVIHEDADRCCKKNLLKDIRRGVKIESYWMCPKCSQEWRSDLYIVKDAEPVRFWRPHCTIEVWVPNR